jgi:hypothetical protein
MTKHSVTDDGDLRKYYAAIPKIVLQLGLNPYELALYVHFKEAAGDKGGVCWKSRATIAKESGMSVGMVTKARVALEMPRAEFNGRPLISVTEEPSKTGGKPTCRIAMTDIWGVNMSKFSTSPYDGATSYSDGEPLATSYSDDQRHHTPLATSPHAPKEEPLKNNNEEDERNFISKLRADPFYSHVDFDLEIENMRRWLARPANRGRRMTERFVLNWIQKIDRPVVLEPRAINTNGDRAAREAEMAKKMGWDKLDQRTA